jgi:hypothetical protein
MTNSTVIRATEPWPGGGGGQRVLALHCDESHPGTTPTSSKPSSSNYLPTFAFLKKLLHLSYILTPHGEKAASIFHFIC